MLDLDVRTAFKATAFEGRFVVIGYASGGWARIGWAAIAK
jgi:hypothetical protein